MSPLPEICNFEVLKSHMYSFKFELKISRHWFAGSVPSSSNDKKLFESFFLEY